MPNLSIIANVTIMPNLSIIANVTILPNLSTIANVTIMPNLSIIANLTIMPKLMKLRLTLDLNLTLYFFLIKNSQSYLYKHTT